MRAESNEANEQVEPTEMNPKDQSGPAMTSTEEEIGNVTEIQIGHGLIARGRRDELSAEPSWKRGEHKLS